MKVIRYLAVILLAPAVAACGSAGPGQSANRSNASGPGGAAFQYARCMRSHGLPSFPDPQVTTTPGSASVKMVVPASVGSMPHFKSAQKACGGIIGNPGNRADHQGPGAKVLLAFARCLRSHGLPTFPDPNRDGQITREMIVAAGVDLHSPVLLTAANACIGVTHGAITRAQIQAAINGPH